MLVRPSTSDDSLITPSLHAKMRVFFEGVDSDAEVQYKHLFSSLQKHNENKTSRLSDLNRKHQVLKQENQSTHQGSNKFFRISSCKLSQSSPKEDTFNSFDENYVSEKMVYESLQKQHLEYENSLLQLKHTIKDLNSEINQINLKQPLYNKVNSIARFQKMASMYTLGRAQREFKKAVKQKEELSFIQLGQDHKKKETRQQEISQRNNIEDKIITLRQVRTVTKQELQRLNNEVITTADESTILSIISYYQRLLELFREKQSQFENLKLENCVKSGKSLRMYRSMPEVKVAEIEEINHFERDYGIKLSSMCNIVEAIFMRLRSTEEQFNFQYEELMLVKEDKLEALEILRQKSDFFLTKEDASTQLDDGGEMAAVDNEIRHQKKQMAIKSKFRMQFIQFWMTLLRKMTNMYRVMGIYEEQEYSTHKEQIFSYFSKYTPNTCTDNIQHMVFTIIREHFVDTLSQDVINQACNMLLLDWKSMYYLKREMLEEEIAHLPSAMLPHQKLYTLVDHLLIETGEAYTTCINQSINIYVSCYSFLVNRKPAFSRWRTVKKRNEMASFTKENMISIPSDNNVKEETLMIPNNSTLFKQPKEDTQKVLIKLLKMASVPIGELQTVRVSKRGCFY